MRRVSEEMRISPCRSAGASAPNVSERILHLRARAASRCGTGSRASARKAASPGTAETSGQRALRAIGSRSLRSGASTRGGGRIQLRIPDEFPLLVGLSRLENLDGRLVQHAGHAGQLRLQKPARSDRNCLRPCRRRRIDRRIARSENPALQIQRIGPARRIVPAVRPLRPLADFHIDRFASSSAGISAVLRGADARRIIAA